LAEEKLLDILLPPRRREKTGEARTTSIWRWCAPDEDHNPTRSKLRKLLRDGKLDERYVELEVNSQPSMPMVEIFSARRLEELDMNIKDMLGGHDAQKTKRRKVKVPEALELLTNEEAAKLVDMDQVVQDGAGQGGAGGHHLSGRDRQRSRAASPATART
jgi:ATP-dependent HslUV protease ATP-binding subunit HslU